MVGDSSRLLTREEVRTTVQAESTTATRQAAGIPSVASAPKMMMSPRLTAWVTRGR